MNKNISFLKRCFLLFSVYLFFQTNIFAQNGSCAPDLNCPCNASFLPVAGSSPILPCGQETSTAVTAIGTPGLSTMSINTPAGCSSPAVGQDVLWSLFGAQAGNFEWQILAPNGNIHYALYELQGMDCTNDPLLLVDCGTQFNTWQTAPVNPISITRYYLAVWADDVSNTNASFQIMFRNGCGGCSSINDCCIAFGGTLDTTPIEACENSPLLSLNLDNSPSNGNFSPTYDYRYYVIDRNGGSSDGSVVLVDSIPSLGPDLSDIDVTSTSSFEICGLSFQRTQTNLSPQVGDSFDDLVTDLDGGNSAFCAHATSDCIPVTINAASPANYTPAIASSNLPNDCGQCTGSISINGFQVAQSYTIYYDDNGTPTSLGPITTNSFGEINLTDLCGGLYSNFITTNNSGCGVSVDNMNSVSLYPNNGESPTATLQAPSACTATDGRLNIENLSPAESYLINYTLNGVAQSHGPQLAAANGVLTIFNIGSGVYDNFQIINSDTNCITNDMPNQPIVVSSGDAPNAPVVVTSISTCETEDINFNVVVPNSATGTTWLWTGPNGFSSTDYEPSIANVSMSDAGVYTGVMTENGCAAEPVEITVNINPVPATPTLQSNGIICQGEDLVLSSPSTCARYFWIPPGGSTSSVATNPLLNTNTNTTTISADADEYVAGNWTLICVENGCNSASSNVETVTINDAPAKPIIQILGIPCEGNEITFRLVNQYPTDIDYTWYLNDPSNGAAPNSSNTTFELNSISSGQFELWVQVEENGCPSEVSNLSLNIDPAVSAAPSFSGGGCNEDLQLMANLNTTDINGLNITWSGPNNFTSNELNPVISNPTAAAVGTYTINVFNMFTGCSSMGTLSGVTIGTGLNYQPNISATTTSLCEGETLNLETDLYNGSDVSYSWTNTANASFQMTTTVPSLSIEDLSLASHSGSFMVQVIDAGCGSNISNPIEITIIEKPVNPTIDAPLFLCAGEDLQLQTSTIADATYTWTGPNNWSSSDQNPIIANVESSFSGSYALQITVNGCSSSNSIAVGIETAPELPILSNNSPICEGENLILNIENPNTDYTYTWNDSQGQTILTGTSLEVNNVFVSDDTDYFVVASNSIGCTSQSPIIGLEVVAVPSLNAQAGTDGLACEDAFQLSANDISNQSNVQGTWTALNGNPVFGNVFEANTSVSNLSQGENTFVWTVAHGICAVSASDTLVLTTYEQAFLSQDEYTLSFGDTLSSFNPFENDILNNDHFLFDFSNSSDGQVVDNGDNTFTYIPNGNFSGTDNFSYTICSELCPNQCTENQVNFIVEEQESCDVPTAFTPNGDGVNDTFVIPCLENGETAQLIVFNRWGDEVFRNPLYKNEWDGTWKNQNLPTGTYFYVLQYDDLGVEIVRGYVYLQRE